MRALLILVSLLSFGVNAEKEEPKETIFLEANFIGDKEQPAVSYFIPWENIGTPDKLQWQISDKIDRTLDLVDRKVMKRSIAIYEELNLEQTTLVNQEN
ncbi:hypothetical protein [Pleionea sediminis]|uniref:hypothetical protein n=1 Tax=Pleionea sediminis TaxID=2569479 RepID=UPI001FE5810E|nr:hypothetical protein [Pleionea sediminis]